MSSLDSLTLIFTPLTLQQVGILVKHPNRRTEEL